MTTYTQFAPNANVAFQFQPTLDGSQYNLVVTWSLFRKGWYINIYDPQGNLIVTEALVGSPDNYDIDLVWGYFLVSTLVFRASTQQFEVNP
jgi:hypothetical protein